MIEAAAQDRDITTPAAAEEILQQQELAKSAGEDLPGKIQTEQARDADRNFIAGLLADYCARAYERAPDAAQIIEMIKHLFT